MTRALSLCEKTVARILSLLTNEDKKNLSFADISEAIQQMLQVSGCSQSESSIAITLDQQILMACYWLNIKESSVLVGSIAELVPDKWLTSLLASQIADLLATIIARCRHRGILDASLLPMLRFAYWFILLVELSKFWIFLNLYFKWMVYL